jgi:molybdenum cofactor guanylyltransferase
MKSCIILCGGRSRRMGQDKGLMALKGRPMILYVLETIAGLCDDIIIVLRDEKQVEEYLKILDRETLENLNLALGVNLNIYTDLIKDQGPLSGIASGLSHIKSDHALIIPCDSPFSSKVFVRKMYGYAQQGGFDLYIPRWPDGRLDPLHAVYHKNSGQVMEELLSKGVREVRSLVNHLNVKYIRVESLDKTGRCFKNLNKPEDILKVNFTDYK